MYVLYVPVCITLWPPWWDGWGWSALRAYGHWGRRQDRAQTAHWPMYVGHTSTHIGYVISWCKRNINHIHSPFNLERVPETPPLLGSVLGLAPLYTSCSFKLQLLVYTQGLRSLFLVPQYYSSPLQFTALGMVVPFVIMSPSFLLFSFDILSFVVQRLFSWPSVLLQEESVNRSNLVFSMEEVEFIVLLYCHHRPEPP